MYCWNGSLKIGYDTRKHGKKSLNSWTKKYFFLQGYSLANERYDLDSLKVHRQTIQGIYNDCVKMCGEKNAIRKSLSSNEKLLSHFKNSQYISVIIASSCWHMLDTNLADQQTRSGQSEIRKMSGI